MFRYPWKYHSNQVNACIHQPKYFFIPLSSSFILPPCPAFPETNDLLFVITDYFLFLKILYSWNNTICFIWPMGSFSQHNYFEFLPYCSGGVSKLFLFFRKGHLIHLLDLVGHIRFLLHILYLFIALRNVKNFLSLWTI